MNHLQGGTDPTPPDPGILILLPHMLLLLAAILAVLLARREKEHRPVALALVSSAVTSLLGWVLVSKLPAWSQTRPPFVGADRAIFHGSQACYLASSALFAWLAFHILGAERRDRPKLPWIVGSLYVIVLNLAILAYTGLRGNALRWIYLAVEVASVAAACFAVARWAAAPSTFGMARRSNVGESVTIAWIVGAAVLLPLGAFPRGLWGVAYHVQQAGLIALYGVLVAVQAHALVRRGT